MRSMFGASNAISSKRPVTVMATILPSPSDNGRPINSTAQNIPQLSLRECRSGSADGPQGVLGLPLNSSLIGFFEHVDRRVGPVSPAVQGLVEVGDQAHGE